MNAINQKSNNDYFYQKSICDYQNIKLYIKQGLRILEEGASQQDKPIKEDFISEKLVTDLNGGVGRMISNESVVPTFGWGSGFFSNFAPLGTSKTTNK